MATLFKIAQHIANSASGFEFIEVQKSSLNEAAKRINARCRHNECEAWKKSDKLNLQIKCDLFW